MRLPTKPKFKPKSKQPNISFDSLDTAKSTAPPSWLADDWLAEGTRQEEQGERYQSGPKAARHINNALTSYRLSSSLDPTAFDPRYNAARALQTLASEHLAPPACLEALELSIAGYREALGVLPPGEDSTERIDAFFNLAQAEVALYEMLDEAVVALEGEGEKKLALAQEAKELFVEVERLQRAAMERFFGEGGPQVGGEVEAGGEEMDDGASTSAGSAKEVQTVETTIVTPHLIIDTLLSSIAFDISLYTPLPSTSSPDATLLRDSVLASLSRATSLRALIPPSPPGKPDELDLDLAISRASVLTTFSPSSDETTTFLDSLSSSLPQPRIEVLSLQADHALDSLPLSSQPLPAVLGALADILKIYQHAATLLSSRLAPPKNTPVASLPSLLSANLTAQSTVHLVAYTLSPSSHQHLAQAHSLALEAITAARSGLALAISTSSPAGAPRPTLALVKAPGSVEPRADWRTLSAVRTALFTLLRVRLRMGGEVEEGRKEVWPLWRALGLAKRAGGGEAEERLKWREIEWWREESGEDKVAEAMGEEERTKEGEYWSSLVQ